MKSWPLGKYPPQKETAVATAPELGYVGHSSAGRDASLQTGSAIEGGASLVTGGEASAGSSFPCAGVAAAASYFSDCRPNTTPCK